MQSSLPYPEWREVAGHARGYLAQGASLAVLDAWLAASGLDQPPARRDLKPEAIAPLLSDIWLMDYEAESGRLRYRLAGENIRARYEFFLVGKYLDEILAPSAKDYVLRYFMACVEKPAICLAIGRLYHEWEKPGYGERVLLPLIDRNGRSEGLLGITVCKETFASREIAERQAKRITCILPLDGSEGSEVAG